MLTLELYIESIGNFLVKSISYQQCYRMYIGNQRIACKIIKICSEIKTLDRLSASVVNFISVKIPYRHNTINHQTWQTSS